MAKVENAGDGEGFIAWRRLYVDALPGTSGHMAARMQALMVNTIRSATVFADMDDFELEVARYEAESKQTVPEAFKIAIVTRGLENDELKRHVLLNSGRLATYSQLRAELTAVLTAQRGVAAMGHPPP